MQTPADKYHFASDNTAGVLPEAAEALSAAYTGFAPAYGTDPITEQARQLIQEWFETECAVHFVFNGTAANALALRALVPAYATVLAHELAHVETDECNAPEFFHAGMKVRTVGGARAKLDPQAVAAALTAPVDVHFSPVRGLSLTQATELGAIYTPGEVRTLCALAKGHGARVHMDGARFVNALAALDVNPAALTWQAGVDILCLGGTKQGMPLGEAIVIFDPTLAQDFAYLVKQSGQLAAKQRYLAAPWVGALQGDAWLRHARHANTMAQTLAARLSSLPGVDVLTPVEANAVFVALPDAVVDALHARGWHFYRFTATHYRLMCSWATDPRHIDAFVDDVTQLVRTT